MLTRTARRNRIAVGMEASADARNSHPGVGSTNLVGHYMRRLSLSTTNNHVFDISCNALKLVKLIRTLCMITQDGVDNAARTAFLILIHEADPDFYQRLTELSSVVHCRISKNTRG